MPVNFLDKIKRRNELYNRYNRETNLTRFEEGSKIRALIDSFMAYEDTIEDLILSDINRTNPLVADGIFQEYWMDFLGINKVEPSKVVAREDQKIVKLYVDSGLTFGDINGGSSITIDPGELIMNGSSRIYSNNQIENFDLTYTNTETITLSAGDSEQYISIEAQGFGEVYRLERGQLSSHSFTDYLGYPNLELKVINEVPLTSGYDGDSDEIISTKILQSSIFSSFDIEDKISNILLEIDDVEDYKIIPRYSGPGTIDIFVDNSFFTISDQVITNTKSRLENIQNKGTQLFVSPVQRLGIFIFLTVGLSPLLDEETKTLTLNEIRDFIYNRLSLLAIGQEINFRELANEIKRNFPEIVSFGNNNSLFDEVKSYKDGIISLKVFSDIDQNTTLVPKIYERVFPETSFPNPIIVRSKNV